MPLPFWLSEAVLPPPVRMDTPQFDARSRVIISPDMFSEENGLIEYYGVVATTNESCKYLQPPWSILVRGFMMPPMIITLQCFSLCISSVEAHPRHHLPHMV